MLLGLQAIALDGFIYYLKDLRILLANAIFDDLRPQAM
jgi:hypothetical protein